MAKTRWTKAKKKNADKEKEDAPLSDPVPPVVEEQVTKEVDGTEEVDGTGMISGNLVERVVGEGVSESREEEKVEDGGDDVEEEEVDKDVEEEENGEDVEEEENDGDELDEEEDGKDSSDGDEILNSVDSTDGDDEEEEEVDGDEEEEDDDAEAIDAMDGSEPMQPQDIFFLESEYGKAMKFGTKCYVEKAVKKLGEILEPEELEWFTDHPQFCHFFHMPKESNHK